MTTISSTLRESATVENSAAEAHRYLVTHFAPRNDVRPTVLIGIPLADLALDREVVVTLSDLPSKPAEYVMEVSWAAAGGGPYPTFIGSLACLPVGPTTSRIELEGAYTIPGGIVGQAFDAAIGRRIAVAGAHSLLRALAHIVETAREHGAAHEPVAASYPPSYE
jgi:hypothetical protein